MIMEKQKQSGGGGSSGGHIRDNGGPGARTADNNDKHGAIGVSDGISGE